MKAMECRYESEVLDAVLQSRWPERVDEGLREHAAECGICAEVAAIAQGMDGEREAVRARAVLPDAGRVWWIAQMRARREAAKAAGRPITAAQVIALASAMGLLGACFGATSTWFQYALNRILTAIPTAGALIAGHGILVLAAAAVVVLVPALVYLAVLRE